MANGLAGVGGRGEPESVRGRETLPPEAGSQYLRWRWRRTGLAGPPRREVGMGPRSFLLARCGPPRSEGHNHSHHGEGSQNASPGPSWPRLESGLGLGRHPLDGVTIWGAKMGRPGRCLRGGRQSWPAGGGARLGQCADRKPRSVAACRAGAHSRHSGSAHGTCDSNLNGPNHHRCRQAHRRAALSLRSLPRVEGPSRR
jgi:hypothetical protein